MPSAGTISELWRYPVKSMGGESLPCASFDAHGIPGDRHWAVYDETKERITNGKKLPLLMQCQARYLEADGVPGAVLIQLPDGRELHSDHEGVHEELSRFLGRPLRLVARQEPEAHFDAYPVSLLSSGSLAALRVANSESKFVPARFRPNLVVDLGDERSAVERQWCGGRVHVGGAQFQVQEPTERCSMIMRAQKELPEDPALLRTVVEDGNHVGVYCRVERGGRVEVGQGLRVTPKVA
jgi:uncharacterized protein YcbX